MSSTRFSTTASGFCSRPLVRRGYSAVVVGLAVFIATLVVLREPFHGYLAEVRIQGPGTAGLDLDAARSWLKAADAKAVVVAVPSSDARPRAELRMTYLSPFSADATSRLDDLAGRFLYQYLPDQLQARRRAMLREARQEVTAAQQRADAAHLAVDRLRQQQLARLLARPAAQEPLPEVLPAPKPPLAAPHAAEPSALMQQIEALRIELSRLLASCTDEHPEVIRLRSQLSQLEEQLRPRPSELEHSTLLHNGHQPGPNLVPASGELYVHADSPVSVANDWAASLEAALRAEAAAARELQSAEHRQSDAMQELAALPTAAAWSARPALVVTRIGGTPRTATLAIGGLLAAVAGLVMFRASGCLAAPKLSTTRELAQALEIPVIGNTSALRSAIRRVRQICTPARVLFVVRAAEVVVVAAAAACLVAVAIEPSLAGQVLADPFGTLSEVVGRLFGP